jgi:hypothetical protein
VLPPPRTKGCEAVLPDYNLQVSLYPSAPCNLDPISQNLSIPEPAVAPDGGGEICACLRACVNLHEERGGRFVTEASKRFLERHGTPGERPPTMLVSGRAESSGRRQPETVSKKLGSGEGVRKRQGQA